MPILIAALIRHGEYHQLADTPSAHQPFPLNREGEEHARAAAQAVFEAMQRNNWQLIRSIDCSHMLRAWQTAHIIADQLHGLLDSEITLESFDALAERGLGCAANLTLHEIEAVIQQDPRFPELPPGWKADSRLRLPLQGAESLLEAGERVAGHLNLRMAALADERRGATHAHGATGRLKLFAGHGGAFRHAAYHLGLLKFEQLASLSMFHGRPVFLEYSASGWRHIEGEWKPRWRASEADD